MIKYLKLAFLMLILMLILAESGMAANVEPLDPTQIPGQPDVSCTILEENLFSRLSGYIDAQNVILKNEVREEVNTELVQFREDISTNLNPFYMTLPIIIVLLIQWLLTLYFLSRGGKNA